MIKSLWNLITGICVANMVAIVTILLWLAATDRVTPERVKTVSATFAPTVAAQAALDAERQRAEADLQAQLEAEGRTGDFPLDTETVMALWNERDTEARQRYQRELAALGHLREDVDQRRQALETEIESFQQRLNQFEQRERALLDQRESDQFQQAVKLLELSTPETATSMLLALIEGNDTDQVVAYLDAIKPDIAQPIFDLITQDDAPLAANLLEQVRTFGLDGPGQTGGTPPNQPNQAIP